MKLDNDIVRDLLLVIEERGVSPHEEIEDLAHPKLDRRELSYYIWELSDAGLIVATDRLSVLADDHVRYDACCLTFKGHDFVDAARDAAIWRQTKEAAKKGGTASLEFLGKLAASYLKQQIKARTGVDLG